MRSLQSFANYPAGRSILADDVLEFHAMRLLLLIKICGTANHIDGLTKLAKLDFFVRYPQFFAQIAQYLGNKESTISPLASVESSMVRFHYGPWDKRYYHIISYLEAKSLILVEQHGRTFRFSLTKQGQQLATQASSLASYTDLVSQMKLVKQVLGNRSGNALKNIIYKIFDKEVTNRRMGEVIE